MASNAAGGHREVLERIVDTVGRVDITAVGGALSMKVGACSTSDGEGRDGGEVTFDKTLKDDLTFGED